MRGLLALVGFLALVSSCGFTRSRRAEPRRAGCRSGYDPGWGTPVPGGPAGSGTPATVTVDPGTTVGTIGADFTGFSSEKTHIMNGSLTSSNTNLIALYELLGSPMLRLEPTMSNVAPGWHRDRTFAAKWAAFNTKVTTGGVDLLCGFLAATGSKAIYGVNFQLDDVTAPQQRRPMS